MSIVLGCIADDYTGASDLASMLSLNGLHTVQTVGVPRESLDLADADAVVVSLKSRSVAAAQAVAMSLEAERWLRGRGAAHVLFKICSTFDSTDAGNIGPVLEALRDCAGASVVPVNPAFPENHRTVFQGCLFIGDRPLHETPMKDHPLNPMRDANLVRVLARQSSGPVGLVPLAVVEAGDNAVRAALSDAAAEGCVAAIIDAVAPRHLDVIGRVALDMTVSTGASGLGSSLARVLVARGMVRQDRAPAGPPFAPDRGRTAILAGSCSAATLRQIAVAEGSMPCRHLDVQALLDGGGEAAAVLGWAGEHLAAGPVLIVSSVSAEVLAIPQGRHGAAYASHAVEQAFADIAAGLVAAGVSRLVVAGGETSGAVVDRLGLQAFRIGEAIAPGVPMLHVVGERYAGMTLALKSGNFGADAFFADALQAMNGRRP